MDMEEPTFVCCTTESLKMEPKNCVPATDKFEPNRLKFLTLKQLPNDMKSNTEGEPPVLREARFPRQDIELPRCVKLSTEQPAPMRV
jgi:hypothetical protein